jgi:endonuclease/exonuclease/phosphatase family metal-dependent hydrolase
VASSLGRGPAEASYVSATGDDFMSAEGIRRVDLQEASVGPAIRVLTLNAHHGFSTPRRPGVLSQIRDALRASQADLVLLQEVGGKSDPDHTPQQYEVLADQVWPQHAYGRNAVSGTGHQGNALLSKYPILSWQNIDVSLTRAEARGFLHCTIEVSRQDPPLHAVCVHFGLRESHRRHQLDRLIELLASIPKHLPLLVGGDFNDWRGSLHRRLVSDPSLALEEIHTSVNGRPARTFPARWPFLRLDRIYVRNLRHHPVELPRLPWATLSDHIPLAGSVCL